MTPLEITHHERAGWQRRAAAELARILDARRDLPVVAWTVGASGATLVGQVNGLQPAAGVRTNFDAWRVALGLTQHNELSSSGSTIYLNAMCRRNHVRVALHATVIDDAWEG